MYKELLAQSTKQGIVYSLEAGKRDLCNFYMGGRIAQGHLGAAGGSPLGSLQ